MLLHWPSAALRPYSQRELRPVVWTSPGVLVKDLHVNVRGSPSQAACPSGPFSIIFLYVACCCHHLNEQATSKISLFYRFFLIRHAGINSKKMLGRAKHGFRERVVDLCPRISDWEEQGGTPCTLLARPVRVTKKANHGKSFQAPWHEGASYLQFTPTWFAFRPLLINLSILEGVLP